MKNNNERGKSIVSKKCKNDATRKFPKISGQNPPDLELTKICQKKIGGPNPKIRPKPSFSVGTLLVGIPLLVKHDKVPYFGISGKNHPEETASHVVFSHLNGAFCVGNMSAGWRGRENLEKLSKISRKFGKIWKNSGKLGREIWGFAHPRKFVIFDQFFGPKRPVSWEECKIHKVAKR